MLLKQKVYTSLVVAILLPLTISTWVFSSYIENFLTEKLETSELPTALAEVRNAIELELSGPIEASKAIAQNTMVEQWVREGEPTSKLSDFTAYLSKNKQANDAITAFIVSGNSNNYYTHDGLVRQISKSEDGWFDAFIRSNKDYELSLDIDKALGEAAVFINYAIVVDGRRVALGGVGRSLTAMTQLVKSYTLAKTGFVYLVDKKGVIQLHPNTDLIGKSINLSEIKDGKIAELDKQGNEVVLSSMELDSLGWHLVAEIPKDELFDAIHYAIIQNVILGLIIAAIGLALVQLLAKQIFLPLDRIHQSVTNLTDKDGDLTARIKVKEDNEVGELAKQINKFLEQLHAMFKQVSYSADQVKHISEQVSERVKYSNNLAETQSQSTHTVAAAVNEMESTVKEISNNASAASKASMQTENSSKEGSAFVSETIEEMNKLQQSMSTTVTSVTELSEEIQSITHVLEVIKGISEQTNLLALNAAIEAARAGEQGRGFAVVADEVRTLAQRTAESTEEINTMITSLRSKASSTVSAIEQGSASTQSTAERLQQTDATLTEITHNIQSLTEMNNQVASATSEQSQATEEINRTVVVISDTTEETKNSMSESDRLCSDLANQANKLEQLMARFTL